MNGSRVPQFLWNRRRRPEDHGQERDKADFRFGVNSLDESIIDEAVVQLSFIQNNTTKGGNGFFVKVPGQDKSVIFTAGHNLIDASGARSTNLKAKWHGAERWTEIAEKDTRISKIFSEKPTEDSAVDDFGIILISANNIPPPPKAAFGFALRLGEEDRLDGWCNVSSYLTTALEGHMPTRSTGKFVSPIMNKNQLEYLVQTEAGVSGSAVWVGYNGSPVAVAIHNYAPKRKSPKYGSRGSRINMKMMREIFEWTGVYKRAVQIQAQPLGKEQTPPLCLTWSEEDKVMRVHVQDESGPKPDESIFEALPVYSSALLQGKSTDEYGYAQPDNRSGAEKDAIRWVSWNVEWKSASLTSALSRARLARWNAKGKSSPISLEWQGNLWDVVVRTDEGVVKKWDLEFPGGDYSGIDYQRRLDNNFKNAYKRFVLRDV